MAQTFDELAHMRDENEQVERRFRPASEADLPSVEEGYLAFLRAEAMGEQRWTVWKEGIYPTRDTAAAALAEGTLYVLEENGDLAASVILNRHQPAEYASVQWRHPAGEDEALVIHTLCVSPAYSGRGVGSEAVRRAIKLAQAQGCRAIRLDTGGQNQPAIGLYRKMGFTLVGGGAFLLDGQLPDVNHVFMEYGL